jgi:Arc/MetJ-type ribon-helix-helix transcriptional regulator
MAQKRRGRPPGKRKEREPTISARIPKDLFKSLEDLAKQRGLASSAQTRSVVVRQALQFWVDRNAISHRHNSRLGFAIAKLADRIEEITDKSWVDDALTRQVVREHVEKLVSDILKPLSEPLAVPAEIKEDAGLILAVLQDAIGPRRLAGTVILDDPGLAMIAQDLGDGRVNVETRPLLVERRKQDNEAWANAKRIGTVEAFTDYLQKFAAPGRAFGRHVTKARERLAALEKQKGRK